MSEIDVFQDLNMMGPEESRAEVRRAFAEAAVAPWSYDAEGSEESSTRGFTEDGLLLFQRQKDDRLPAARLVLWSEETGFSVPNIVPADIGELSTDQYNALLVEFARLVAEPVAARFGWHVALTAPAQGLEDWLDEEAAAALRRFSTLANKSTGASHPLDQRRWFDFIIATHRGGKDIGPDRLSRWLHEVDGWDEDSAHRLAGDYETSRALLDREAETR